jgi:hypothetical protein
MAKQLFNKFGSGFSRSNLIYMRKLFLFFPFREMLSKKLSWSHYFEILKTNDRAAITWLVRQCEEHSWSVRQLKEQIKAGAHHWITITNTKPKTTTRESTSLRSWFKTQLSNLKQPQTQKNLQFVRRSTS